MTDYKRFMLFLKNFNQISSEFMIEEKGRYLFLKDSKAKSMNAELFFDEDDNFMAMWTGKDKELAVYDEGRQDDSEWLKKYGSGDYLDELLGTCEQEEIMHD